MEFSQCRGLIEFPLKSEEPSLITPSSAYGSAARDCGSSSSKSGRNTMKRLTVLTLALIVVLTAPGPTAQASQVRIIQQVNAAGSACPRLPSPIGNIVNVSSVAQLENAVNHVTAGTTILVADGVYQLNGVYLRIAMPDVTLRSASGNRETVILDGNYQTTEIIQVVA